MLLLHYRDDLDTHYYLAFGKTIGEELLNRDLGLIPLKML